MADVTVVTPPTGDSGESVLVAFARLEGKVDVVLTRHDARLESLEADRTDHEARIRAVEARPTVPAVIEERLRALEDKPDVPPVVDTRIRAVEDRRTVSPRDLLITSGSIVALVVGIITAIDRLAPAFTP